MRNGRTASEPRRSAGPQALQVIYGHTDTKTDRIAGDYRRGGRSPAVPVVAAADLAADYAGLSGPGAHLGAALAAGLGPKIAAHDAAGMQSAIEDGVAAAEADWA